MRCVLSCAVCPQLPGPRPGSRDAGGGGASELTEVVAEKLLQGYPTVIKVMVCY